MGNHRAGVACVQEEIRAIRQPRWTDRRCALFMCMYLQAYRCSVLLLFTDIS